MGNCPSYCSSCCCSSCKYKDLNEETRHSSVSVITEQPSSSGNNTNSNSEQVVNKSPIRLPPEHKGNNEISNNNRFVTANLEISKKERPIIVKQECRNILIENGELVKKVSLRREPSTISSNLKYPIDTVKKKNKENFLLESGPHVAEGLRRKSSNRSSKKSSAMECLKKYREIVTGKDELVKKHSLRRKSSNNSSKSNYSEKSSSLDTYNKIYREIIKNIKNLKLLKDTQPQKVTHNSEILTKSLQILLEKGEFGNFTDPLLNNPDKIYTLKPLDENSLDYTLISNFFTSTNKRCYRIQKIEKIYNPYLFLQYRLKYLEYVARKKKVSEWMMFHGTTKTNLDNICRNNFNWRLNGKKLGTKNGKGVNFASNAYFSTHYGDTGFNKAMILAKVLIGKSCQGSNTVSVPPEDIDTTTDHRQPPQVYVKYDDNTFYPAYIIYYGGIDNKYANGGLRRGRGRGRGRFSGGRILYNR